MVTKVKICGIKTLNEALAAIDSGAWAIGEVFAASSRQIDVEKAAALNMELGRSIVKIGVFVDEKIDNLKHIARTCFLDMVQLHGEEPPEYLEELMLPVIKSFRLKGPVDPEEVRRWRPQAYLFDAYSNDAMGGTGKAFRWEWLDGTRGWENFILAGGLNQENVGHAIAKVRPMAVDVSSGVEYPQGGKDPLLIEQFIRKVKEVDINVSRL
ncbi:MAG: phosphoribosylanthranilate isomerase [Syntrophomonadaceae bacterium]|nr:phosphoribosylanthranilate isomerase [Syntrophomonadaceae bacterium]MDD3023656.1 phosphoribosylanthranilate isomerase [Syntrophomonadaceae bacterium]